ncbi:helix-turn-helix domain-containing protein [Streptomyces griseocarneus]|uniref:helix-turn-helix domain-containing protein n=1 Tax=Streptomyces griseocarneus TaxID=51201 RepID=UPI00167E5B0C|nr:pyridoxamine 5'-phosphate oxidase family protein [Streptomyces griseocarneus]MBZ6477486.1 pyridoxamine 5'-phosphate oxidase family protein [Streptomyces griseocarneus]GHG49351.1 DNA-binding protein [Streptomyces griseocarneus]
MDGEAPRPGDPAGSSPREDTVAVRSALRRAQLGLTEEEVAGRAGMSLAYLRQLETFSGDFDPAAVMRLAAALEMSYEELTQGRGDAPPGQRAAGAHPTLMRLSERECWDRLGTHGIGRLGLSGDAGPVLLPVNFLVDARTIVYRTEADGAAAVASGTRIAFETDHLDEQRASGWSVLVTGTADRITDAGAVRVLSERPGARPWPGGRRDVWVRIVPDQVSGRAIRAV